MIWEKLVGWIAGAIAAIGGIAVGIFALVKHGRKLERAEMQAAQEKSANEAIAEVRRQEQREAKTQLARAKVESQSIREINARTHRDLTHDPRSGPTAMAEAKVLIEEAIDEELK